MAIRKMKFITIIGDLGYFDEFVYSYIIDSNLHPENALNIIKLVKGTPFENVDLKSDTLLKTCVSLMDLAKIDYSKSKLETHTDRPEMYNADDIEILLNELDSEYRADKAEYEQPGKKSLIMRR